MEEPLPFFSGNTNFFFYQKFLFLGFGCVGEQRPEKISALGNDAHPPLRLCRPQ
jgi:hypothetical protein